MSRRFLTAGIGLLLCWNLAGCKVDTMVRSGLSGGELKQLRDKDFSELQIYYLGRLVLARFLALYPYLRDRQITEYVTLVGRTLAAYSERGALWDGYRFVVVRSPAVDAYSLPGGFILVSTGLLALCENEDQLAAVLAHELAHTRYRHAYLTLKQVLAAKMRIKLFTSMLQNFSDEYGRLGKIVADVNLRRMFANYSQGMELEADAYGCRLLVRAGYDPRAMLRILSKLPGGRSAYAVLHPKTAQRLKAIRQEIAAHRRLPLTSRVRTRRYRRRILSRLKRRALDRVDLRR